MDVQIAPSWKFRLNSEFEKGYFKKLVYFVKKEYTSGICYPKGKDIFEAFNICPFESVKVVIIGQDPYHGPGQANGLCFSVHKDIEYPPSLMNIFKELQTDLQKNIPKSGDLSKWAKQGVLLLNSILTVRACKAGSHQQKGWEIFTDAIIELISNEKENVVFLLWGGYAKRKGAKIDRNKHLVLTSGHPSPLSANKGFWFGNKHFSRANNFLESKDETSIDWFF